MKLKSTQSLNGTVMILGSGVSITKGTKVREEDRQHNKKR